jgi:flavin-dependent dehydrogenase
MNGRKLYCELPGRDLPVIQKVDIIIAGATLGSISAAIKAAKKGCKVFVIAYMPYLGEDICGTYKYLFEEHESNHPLLEKIFPEGEDRKPFIVKKALENELIDNNIDFLYSSYVSEILLDKNKRPTGVVITNRSGQQVIYGKVIIDSTQRASVAKLAGAEFEEEKTDLLHKFQFITVGNTSKPPVEKRLLPISAKRDNISYPCNEYTFFYPAEDLSYLKLNAIEQKIRGDVWDPDQVDAADNLYTIPYFKIKGVKSYNNEKFSLDNIPVEACIPRDINNIYVLGYCADLNRSNVEELGKPQNAVLWGEKVGEAAAMLVRRTNNSFVTPVYRVSQNTKLNTAKKINGIIRISSMLIRPVNNQGCTRLNNIEIPVIGEYDVVVMGGGTAGANSGISAARHGARTLVIEYLHGLGGLSTMGKIGVYWDGFREGFTKEIDRGVSEMAPSDHPRQLTREGHSNFDWKTEWYRKEILKAGGDIWFGVLGCGALVEQDKVKGVLAATPDGLGVVLAHVVIDSTGSGDIAIAAGADYEHTDENLFAVQGAGLPPVNLGDYYNNTDWTFIDDNDVYDITRLYVSGKAMFDNTYDIGKLPQTRERRRIIGEHVVSVLDIINHRRYEDTISYHKSSFDTHGYTIDPFFTILPPEKRHTIYEADVPLRSLLPKGLENIIVTGLGASAHRDAMPVIRMQPCLQNQGYSVGYLSALASHEKITVRQVDIKKVQAYLVDKGILPKRVLTDADNFPYSEEQLKNAVKTLPNGFKGLEILLTNPQKAEELLLEAWFQSEQNNEKLVFAQVLSMLGNGIGIQVLMEEVKSYDSWDEGWDYTGMGQFGPCMSRLDSLIIALGQSRQEEALEVILEKAYILSEDHAFSHYRAIAMACETIGSPAAVPVLSALLMKEGRTGHHITTLKDARDSAVPDRVDVTLRNNVLREIFLARALYRCGDDSAQNGKKILQNYSKDLHGHYFRHAYCTLKAFA